MNMDVAWKAITGLLMLLLTTMAGLAADRAADANHSLAELTQNVSELTVQTTLLAERVENLPPPDLLLRVGILEKKVEELEK